MRLPPRLAAVVAAPALLVGLTTPAAPNAAAETAQRFPVANDDAFAVYTGATYRLDPIANDTTFLGGENHLCGVTVDSALAQQAYVAQDADRVVVEARPGATQPLRFTYDVCQGDDQRDTATIEITLRQLEPLTGAVKRNQRGKARFTNAGDVEVRVRWGSSSGSQVDGDRVVRPGSTVVVTAKRQNLYWVGYLRDGDAVVPAGDGVLRGLKVPGRRR